MPRSWKDPDEVIAEKNAEIVRLTAERDTAVTDWAKLQAVHDKQPRSVCRVMFQREKSSGWEYGVAICRSPGASDIVCIIPDDAETSVDVLSEVWTYMRLEYRGAFIFDPSEGK